MKEKCSDASNPNLNTNLGACLTYFVASELRQANFIKMATGSHNKRARVSSTTGNCH